LFFLSFTINNVQNNTAFHWQYQRYLLVCEYFEKPVFAYPPLTILPHICLLLRRIFYTIAKPCCRDFRKPGEKVFSKKSIVQFSIL